MSVNTSERILTKNPVIGKIKENQGGHSIQEIHGGCQATSD